MQATRKRVLRAAGSALAALVLVLLLVPVLVLRSSGFRDYLSDRALVGILGKDQRLRLEQVEHLGPRRVLMRGIRIEARRPEGWVPWLCIGSLDASWLPREVLAGRYYLTGLALDSVRVDIGLIPSPLFVKRQSVPLGPERVQLPPLRCPRLALSRVLVRGVGSGVLEGSLALRGLTQEEGRFSGVLESACVIVPAESLDLGLRGGRVQGELGRDLRVDSLSVRSPGISGGLSASWESGRGAGRPARIRGEIALSSLVPWEIARFRRLGLPLSHEDAVQGRLNVNAAVAPTSPVKGDVTADLSGRLFGQTIESVFLRGSASPDSAAVDSLLLQAGAFHLEGSGRWIRSGARAAGRLTFSGCDLSSGFVSVFARGLPSSKLAGTVEAEADSIGPRLRLAARLRLEPGLLLQRPVSGFSARAILDPERLTVERLETAEPGSPALTANGFIDRRTGTAQAGGTLHGFSLADWIDPWLDRSLEGFASGPFHVEGPLHHLRVGGDLTVRKGRIEKAFIDSLKLDSIAGSLSPLALTGKVEARGLDLFKVPLDSLRGAWSVADTIRADFVGSRDTTRIRLVARVVPGRQGRAFLDTLWASPGTAPRVELAAPATIDFSRSLVHCDSVRVRSEAGTVAGSGWIEPRPGAAGTEPFGFHLRGSDINLGLVAEYFGISHDNLDGTADVIFDGDGRMESPRYQAAVDVSSATAWGWNLGMFSLKGSAGDLPDPAGGVRGVVRVDSLRVLSSGYAGGLPGPERTGPEPPRPPIRILADSVEVASNRSWASSLAVLRDSLMVLLDTARLRGDIEVRSLPVAPILSGVIHPRNAQTSATVLEPVDPMLSVIRVERPEAQARPARRAGIGGRVSLRARLAGTGARPRIACDLRGERLRVYQAWADSVLVRLSYADSLLTLASLDWHMGSTHAHSQGTVPLLVTADPKKARLLHLPLHLETTIPEIDLSLASLATRVIQEPSGTMSGSFTLNGIPPRIYPLGDLSVRDGAFRIQDREDRISRLEAELHLDSTGVHIVSATGRLNDTGNVTASGYFRDIDHFDLKGSVRNGTVFQTGDYRFVADADVEARPIAEGDSLRPELSGKVTVQDGLLTVDLAKPPPPGLPARTPWLIDVEVLAPGSIRVNQPAMTVDVGQADLIASFRWPYWNLGGTVQVLDGTYRIFNRVFDVTSGTVTFEDIGQGPRPVFDVQAQTQLAGGGPDSGPITVILTVKGRPVPAGAQVDPTAGLDVSMKAQDDKGADLSLTQAQLIEMLSVGQLTGGQFGSFRSSDPTRQFFSTELVGQIERQLVQQVPYADRVQLEGEIGGDKPLWVSLRPIVQPQWYLDYAQQLTATPERKVSVNYRLSNLFFLNAGIDRAPRPSDVPLDTYSLDLKLRIEY